MALRAVIEHPKFTRLCGKLRLPRYAALGLLEAMWHFTGRFAPQGNIGKYDTEEIEAWIGWDGEPGALVAAFVECRWIDADETHRLVVHDWHVHADNATKLALKRSGLNFVYANHQVQTLSSVPTVSPQCRDDVSETATVLGLPVPVPVPGADDDSSLRSESYLACSAENEIVEAIPIDDDEPPNWFEMFWDAYPPRAGDRKRAASEAKFKTRVKDGVDPRVIIAGAERYRAYCDATRKTKTELVQQATTWLNNRAWLEPFEIPDDAPSPPQRNGRRESQSEVYARLERERLARVGGAA